MPPTLPTTPGVKFFAWLVVCCLLQGCSQWYYDLGRPLSEDQTPAVDDGVSLAAVLEQLGPPMRLSATAGGYVMAWEHWLIQETSVGLSLGPMGADFLAIDWGDARVRGEFILLTFNRQHELTGSAFSTWDADAGGGAALQPTLGISLVDVDDLTRRMPHHDWGATSLRRLAEALNTPSRPDVGQSGIQQRGTPVNIGQQSLEMD
jgi:hypothetical protein